MSSPSYTTATSTPKSTNFVDLITVVELGESFSTVPFNWENKPGLPKPSFPANHDNGDGLTLNSTYNEVKETKGTLKPPPPMPLSELSFSRRRSMKRSVWSGRRSCSCDMNVDFDPFEAALEKVVEESVTMTPFRGDHHKWRVNKFLNFPRSSFSDHKISDHSAGSSFSSTGSSAGSSSGSLLSPVEPAGERFDRGSTSTVVKMREYKYNKWIVGCLGFHKGGSVHKFVKDFVAL